MSPSNFSPHPHEPHFRAEWSLLSPAARDRSPREMLLEYAAKVLNHGALSVENRTEALLMRTLDLFSGRSASRPRRPAEAFEIVRHEGGV